MSKPRVLLAEDHSLLREGLRQLLADRVDVVGTVGDGRSLHGRESSELQPDIVLLDISMPQLNGFDAAQQLRRSLTADVRDHLRDHARRPGRTCRRPCALGACGYVVKSAASTELLAAIDAALHDVDLRVAAGSRGRTPTRRIGLRTGRPADPAPTRGPSAGRRGADGPRDRRAPRRVAQDRRISTRAASCACSTCTRPPS
jgi:CheY-like chemotaxis protein